MGKRNMTWSNNGLLLTCKAAKAENNKQRRLSQDLNKRVFRVDSCHHFKSEQFHSKLKYKIK